MCRETVVGVLLLSEAAGEQAIIHLELDLGMRNFFRTQKSRVHPRVFLHFSNKRPKTTILKHFLKQSKHILIKTAFSTAYQNEN